MPAIEFTLNGKRQSVEVSPQMPLLWVLRDTLGLTGTKFGCGLQLCGACTVHINGVATRSCGTPISTVAGKNVTTIEGLVPGYQPSRCSAPGSKPTCRSAATASPDRSCRPRLCWRAKQNPTDADIDQAMRGNLCRCGTYSAIREAIHRAARYASGSKVATTGGAE